MSTLAEKLSAIHATNQTLINNINTATGENSSTLSEAVSTLIAKYNEANTESSNSES